MRTVHAGPSFYDTLQVSPRASAPVIKAAFRCLAQLNHPDKNLGDDTAADRLMAVVKAYLVLSDPEQRRTYDLTDGAGQRVVERRGMGSAAANHSRPGDPQKTGMRLFAFRPLD